MKIYELKEKAKCPGCGKKAVVHILIEPGEKIYGKFIGKQVCCDCGCCDEVE